MAATACAIPFYPAPSPTPTVRAHPTRTPSPAVTPLASPLATGVATTSLPAIATTIPTAAPATVAPTADFCSDAKVLALINSLKSALLTANGQSLASLVSPTHGVDARLYRNGRVVNYDQEHAQFLFQSTFAVNWGAAPASGLETTGSFHEVILPALLDVFGKNYTLTCNQLDVGGTTYQTSWPYAGIRFYSVYFPGTAPNGALDWRTWVLGMHYVNAKPYLYAIMQFFWEP
jgi:hypothetical protein